MRILTVEIDKERDLSALEDFLKNMGLKYQLEDNDFLEASINTALDQSKKGTTKSHKEIMDTYRAKYR